MRKGVVYYIESAVTGRIYVGSTTRGQAQRWAEHLHYLRNGKHHCRHLQRVYNKHGEEDLTCRVAEHVEDELFLLAREQFHLWRHEGQLMNGVAVSDALHAANAANRGRVMPAEERARRSAIAKGKPKGPFSDEHK
ncbi:MAG TPA: GIY-YIG nuclease family protein, partial [Rhizobacter sp.]